jgi:hypothetical protein
MSDVLDPNSPNFSALHWIGNRLGTQVGNVVAPIGNFFASGAAPIGSNISKQGRRSTEILPQAVSPTTSATASNNSIAPLKLFNLDQFRYTPPMDSAFLATDPTAITTRSSEIFPSRFDASSPEIMNSASVTATPVITTPNNGTAFGSDTVGARLDNTANVLTAAGQPGGTNFDLLDSYFSNNQFDYTPNANIGTDFISDLDDTQNALQQSQDSTIDESLSFGDKLDIAKVGVAALTGLTRAYLGFNQLALQEEAFDFNKKMTRRNFRNQEATIAAAERDQDIRRATFGQASPTSGIGTDRARGDVFSGLS